MRASIVKPVLKIRSGIALLIICLLLCSFKGFMDDLEWTAWGNRFLNETYDPSVDANIKKFEINLTPDHFIRLRKTYQQGKQEYFSFRINRMDALNFKPGTANTDTLEFKTVTDDIIYQTFEDPAGDLDSMVTQWDLPVKKLSPKRLDSLKEALTFLKGKNP
ncbi:hypothetical protein FPZ42_01120 [Mucilaginibacter achroorhodeus]|uniref:Uncharacterized protein n=1 Tax=Mucilaginibacter achroorhodeus TaxID=2599294 RepID=A0A563U983_9SPHI|nr:hypothetical protein [Mucilaginibacter achroorhodeus]TWR27843.1 hypothetical protein FPZ42_01120 [Mucilaginibacter achroorhodeus]